MVQEQTKLENVSVSDLIKKSAKQICFFRKKKMRQQVTPGMIKGNEAAERKTISEYREMRGSFVSDEMLLHYSFDEIKIDGKKATLIEHKNIDEDTDVAEWYVNYSILQLAVYTALLLINPSKEYFTAKFFRKQGYNTHYLDLSDVEVESLLHIGDDKYSVKCKDPKKLVQFYLDKLETIFEYDTAEKWDKQWKFKEFEHLKKYITFAKL